MVWTACYCVSKHINIDKRDQGRGKMGKMGKNGEKWGQRPIFF